MLGPEISLRAITPRSGFRWIYRGPRGEWVPREPPEDWPDSDYRATERWLHGPVRAPKPKLASRFYLAANHDGFWPLDWVEGELLGTLISEPELYLRIASGRPTPAVILQFA